MLLGGSSQMCVTLDCEASLPLLLEIWRSLLSINQRTPLIVLFSISAEIENQTTQGKLN